MIVSKLTWPVAGFLAAAGVLEVADVILPPPITGVGSYDAPVTAGDTVLVSWVIDKNTRCPGKTSRVWDGQQHFHLTEPQQLTTLPEGRSTPQIETRIPTLAPPGELLFRVVGYFQCEGEPRQDFELGPVLFEVIP